jgi:Skp family chaperone for outer membrane proteins
MKKTIHIVFTVMLLLLISATVSAQTDQVCISQEDANKCAKRAVEARALREENAELKKARADDAATLEDLKTIIQNLKIELAKTTGQLTESEKAKAEQRAIIEFLLKYPRKKFSLIDIF